jgi:hypothetical protein
MKIVGITGIVLVFSLLCMSFVSAEQANDTKPASEYMWNGTWSSQNYTLYITQDESKISGVYVPFDLFELDPGLLEGNLSADGKTYSGIWIEKGSNINTLSGDMMSFSISGYADPQGPMTGPTNYTSNATRTGEIVDPANPWTGNYVSDWKTFNLTQDGTVLTGTNEPLPEINDNPGIINGTVTEDGMTFAGTWIEKGKYTFLMADDGMSMNVTITKSLEPDAMRERMTFSR